MVLDAKAIIGEGPYYEEDSNQLLWVDIEGRTVNCLNLTDGSNQRMEMNEYKFASAVIPTTCAANQLIVSLERTLSIMDRNTGKVLKELCTVEQDKAGLTRINDAKCDGSGRLWFGTMGLETAPAVVTPKQGSLYSYDGETVKHHVSGIDISNGLEWSIDRTVMYYIDSIPATISSFKYDAKTGDISDRKVIINYRDYPDLGLPDGMTIDAEGKLWVAGYSGANVTRWDPVTGEKLATIPIPARGTTSCCFGGPNYDVLYVTSACIGASNDDWSQYPYSGGLFAVRGLPVKGLPPNKFDNSKCQ